MGEVMGACSNRVRRNLHNFGIFLVPISKKCHSYLGVDVFTMSTQALHKPYRQRVILIDPKGTS